MSSSRIRAAFVTALACACLPLAGWAGPPDGGAEGPAPEATWRFKKSDRPVKVVVLAGSVGAWPKQPFAKRFEQMCPNIEVKNLSKVGQGALALKKRFKAQVIDNRWLNFGDDDLEFWLVFQGGLNSIAMPEKTNRWIRDVSVLAHRRGMSVVQLSLLPWGAASDKKRWSGAEALRYHRNTRKVVDFILGRLEPGDAFGSEVDKRKNPAAPWEAAELADVAIDLYDSPLRDSQAQVTDFETARRVLERDSDWKRRNADLEGSARDAALDADARELAAVPRWWMKPQYRAFDHIHPNTEGHDVIARWSCPALPRSWGCSCPPEGAGPGAARTGPSWDGAIDPAGPIR